MAYYKDLREYLATLEEHGKLIRIQFPVNKDTELHPLVRLQYRGLPESERKDFLFENITDSRGGSEVRELIASCHPVGPILVRLTSLPVHVSRFHLRQGYRQPHSTLHLFGARITYHWHYVYP